MSKRRGSRLFSGQPGMLLVSEDIPGITMPAPPSSAAPLEEEEPDFDLDLFHAEEDREEEEASHDGPLRVFLGNDSVDLPSADEDTPPVFDVSALAMPAGPIDDGDLDFLDDSVDVDEEDIVDLGTAAPPSLSMGVSSAVSVDDASAWDEHPTNPGPAAPSTAVIRDTPPPTVQPSFAEPDAFDLPEALDPFADNEPEDAPTQVMEGAPAEMVWDDDDTGFFDPEPAKAPGLPSEPPQLKLDVPSESRTFRAIPDKEDPPILTLAILMIAIAITAVYLGVREGVGEQPAASGAVPVAPVQAPQGAAGGTVTPAPRTEARGQMGEVATAMGFLTIESDEAANIYVDDRRVGITPVIKTEVTPGRHHVLAVEVDTGKRHALTADVAQGEERTVRFAFQPVQ